MRRTIRNLIRKPVSHNIVDSGMVYGYIHEHKVPKSPIYRDPFGYYYISLGHFLDALLGRLSSRYTQYAQEIYYSFDRDEFIRLFEEKFGLHYRGADNTYNFDNDLDQGFNFELFVNDKDDEYLLIRTHNGCDIRWGYTEPYVFHVYEAERVYYCSLEVYCPVCCMTFSKYDIDSDDFKEDSQGFVVHNTCGTRVLIGNDVVEDYLELRLGDGEI